ncbi:MAG TPA: hypothetical protein VJP79_02430 [Nitrososphaera sp.]|nr:hypothetical protein [Nitrososphaera sp.]
MSLSVYYEIPYSGEEIVRKEVSRLQKYYELESSCLTVGESDDDLGVDVNLSIVYDVRKLTNSEYGQDIANEIDIMLSNAKLSHEHAMV